MRKIGTSGRWISGPVMAALLALPHGARAQSWALVDGLGYGTVGAGVGAAAAWNMEPGPGWAVIASSAGAGVVVGALVGRAADRRLGRGEPIGGGHRAAVVMGSVLAGMGLGALGSAALIAPDGEGTFLGSDDQTFLAFTLGGAVLGGAFVWWRRDALEPRAVTATPAVSASGGVGMRVQVRF